MRTLKIKDCDDCPFSDHTGGFTPGGAFMTCTKAKEVRHNKEGRKYLGYRKINPDAPEKTDRWSTLREYDGKVPDWCPLDEVMKLEEDVLDELTSPRNGAEERVIDQLIHGLECEVCGGEMDYSGCDNCGHVGMEE